jgi:putative PEP-CTERM system histidine kinase
VIDFSAIIAFCAALLAVGTAVAVAASAKTLPHWVFVAGMFVLGVESFFVGLTLDAVLPEQAARCQAWRLVMLSFVPGIWMIFSFVYARENRLAILRKTEWFWAAALLVPPAIAFYYYDSLVTEVMPVLPGGSWMISIGRGGMLLNICLLLGAILIMMNLERTFRSAVGTMRWRIKFMVIGLGILFGLRAFTSSQVILFKSINMSLQIINSSALLVCSLLIARTLLRTGHFEVSVYVSRSVLQGSLTVFFAGVYLVVLGLGAKLTASMGGDAGFQFKAFGVLLALVLLAVVLLSDRVRLHIRRFLSRHFQRPMHDYREVWRTFIQRSARCVEQTSLCKTIATLVSEVFQALSVGVWMADEHKKKLILRASTSLSDENRGETVIEGEEAANVIKALEDRPEPIDIDASKELWAVTLRRRQPAEFPHGGNRICVPVIAGGELIGLVIVGDRVAGVRYSTQDYELLKTLGDQAAASLLNLRLSEKLGQARQFEAFQAMSAFFVHDLKNTASTLSLMLKNLPVHYDKPEFREDALRGITKTVTHINDLIERLNMLRHELQVQEVECDLNQLVSDTLRNYESNAGMEFVKQLGAIPKLRLDPTQIQKVLTNLVLNARDAIGGNGQVKIETSRRNGWVVLAVADNGCGMAPEFIRDSLFRPFQSTKQKGLGIGMFHCKMIVEAHRGRVEVESAPGKGTQFRVLLPV